MLAVLLKAGEAEPNPALQFALELAPSTLGGTENAAQRTMNINDLLPEHDGNHHRPYIYYIGSLTTPPCSEVQWYVFAKTVKIPESQVLQFQSYTESTFPGQRENAQPLQPLGQRALEYDDFLS